jgi:hypothetical protein
MRLEDLAGTWQLVAFEAEGSDGEVLLPFGPSPRGQIMFDATGNMSAHVFGSDRPRFAKEDPRGGSDAEVRRSFEASVGYYGRSRLDPEARTLTTRVEGSLFPNWEGSEQVRSFDLDGDRLVLRPPPIEAGGVRYVISLRWERTR